MRGKEYLTALGKACVEDVKRYPTLDEYYDPMSSLICIPLSVYLNTPKIQRDTFSLIGSKNLVGLDACWAMTRGLIGDKDGELIPGVIITSAVDLLV